MARAELALVLLAAGKGTRMRSATPKVLHTVCGRPIVGWAVRLGQEIGAKRIIVVVGSEQDEVQTALAPMGVETVVQADPLGTAHAALQARSALADHEGPVLIMNGDHPLYRAETIAAFLESHRSKAPALSILTTELPDPTGYGRIVRGASGDVQRIVEERDADTATRAICEVNLGGYLAEGPLLFETLARIGRANDQNEYYLTDAVELVRAGGGRVEATRVADWQESLGINSRADLARAEAIARSRIQARWMAAGVTFVHPENTYVDADVEIGADTVIAPGVVIRGISRIGTGCRIDAGCVIEDSTLEAGTWLKPHCHLESATLGRGCRIGPSAHLRPQAVLEDGVRIGNFVEVKNSRFGRGSKADHLSYIGDSDVGEGVTLGCGSVTVNYDGRAKHRTRIGDRAFVGCNANLIAPVEIAPGAYVAAGSTITNDVPADALGVARARQRNIEGWRARRFGNESGH